MEEILKEYKALLDQKKWVQAQKVLTEGISGELNGKIYFTTFIHLGDVAKTMSDFGFPGVKVGSKFEDLILSFSEADAYSLHFLITQYLNMSVDHKGLTVDVTGIRRIALGKEICIVE
jgi:hypothetical protein